MKLLICNYVSCVLHEPGRFSGENEGHGSDSTSFLRLLLRSFVKLIFCA